MEGAPVVDTVHFNAPHELRSEYIGPERTLPHGWEFSSHRKTVAGDDDHYRESETRTYKHVESGLKAVGDDVRINKVEVSLPRVLHGSNGKLIKSDLELEDALCRALAIVREIAIPTNYEPEYSICEPEYSINSGDPDDLGSSDEKFRFQRVDLVWQFRGNPKDFITAHFHLRHKRVRRATGHYDGQSLYWPGTGFRVCMYDKELELNKRRGDVIRVEVQIRGMPSLRKWFGFEKHLTDLRFDECYDIYRTILCEFNPSPLPEVGGLVELLAVGERNGWKHHGVGIFDLWAREKNPNYARQVKTKMAKLNLREFGINWSELLPEQGPPEPVEVEPRLLP